MRIEKVYPIGFAANTYFVTEDGKNAVAVDPAQPRASEEAARLGLTVKAVLLTHGHFDHIGGCSLLQRAGAKIFCLKGEEDRAVNCDLSEEFGFGKTPPFTIDGVLSDGQTLLLCGMRVEVTATPGHTAGSACYLFSAPSGQRVLFTGDTLFCGGVGRTDLPTGSARQLQESLKKLRALPFDCPVCAGHGEDTTLLHEKMYNGYLKC